MPWHVHFDSQRPTTRLRKNRLPIPGQTPLKKVDQTYTSDKDGFGNCLQAAIATLFSLDIDDVVDLRPMPYTTAPSQDLRLKMWLRGHGWSMLRVSTTRPYVGYYIASGLVTRSIYIPHAVVMYNGDLYHDPHPSRAGLCMPRQTLLFYPL